MGRRSVLAPLTALTQAIDQVGGALLPLESLVVQEIAGNLCLRKDGTWTGADDDLFTPLNAYCVESWSNSLEIRPPRLWNLHISPIVREVEDALAKNTPPDRIHKGAPLYNVGVCYVLSGDLDRAMVYIAEAGEEEEKFGRGGGRRISIGDNALSEQILVDPVLRCKALSTNWAADYKTLTGKDLGKGELKDLLHWLSLSPQPLLNAVQTVVSLHRYRSLEEMPDNDAARHLRVQALADLVLVVESSLRHWQSAVSGQLHNRMQSTLSANPTVNASFQAAQTRYCAVYPREKPPGTPNPDRETPAAVNWEVNDALANLRPGSSTAVTAGIACYLIVSLRNSLMHVISKDLELYKDKAKCDRVFGLVLSVVRISKHGHDGTLLAL